MGPHTPGFTENVNPSESQPEISRAPQRGKKAAAAAAAADELQFFSRAFAEVLRFSPLLGNRTHTPARRHGSVSTGPLQTSRGERHAEGTMEEPGARGTGFLFSLNSEGPTRFPKRGGKEKAAC